MLSMLLVDTPMQYTVILFSRKNDNFQLKNIDIFLIFVQNIDCGYTLEPPQSMFQSKNKKKIYIHIKVGCKGVFITRTCLHDVDIALLALRNPFTFVMSRQNCK